MTTETKTSNKKELTFRNAMGALNMVTFGNATVQGNQYPHHDLDYSSQLKGTTQNQQFDLANAEVDVDNFEFQITASDRPQPIPKNNTVGKDAHLETASRVESIEARVYKPRERVIPKETKDVKKFKANNVTKITNSINTANGACVCVECVSVPVIKVNNPREASNSYFRGGEIFNGGH